MDKKKTNHKCLRLPLNCITYRTYLPCRKNPAHFREYSHEFGAADSEESEGEEMDTSDLPECPYGASCYRKNPAHFREYLHPEKGKVMFCVP